MTRPISSYRADSPDIFWLWMFFLAALNWFDSSRSPLAVSTEVYGVPISPLFIVLSLMTLILGVKGVLARLSRVSIWEGKLEVKSRFGSHSMNLSGAKLRYGPYGLLRAGLTLEDAEGKRIPLPLPRSTNMQPHPNLILFSALNDWGVDIGSGALSRFAGQPSDVRGCTFDRAALWKLKAFVIVGVALMVVPEGSHAAFGERGVLPIWLNWMIFMVGFSLSTGLLLAIPDPPRPFPKNGLVLESGEVTLLREGETLWKAPLETLRVEVARPPGHLTRRFEFKAWSGDAPLRLPGHLDRWRFDAEDISLCLLKLGVPVAISDEVWEANS